MPEPLAISAVMPVYNTPIEYLRETVESVLNQTYRDFELIVLDDASEPYVEAYFTSLKHPQIIYERFSKNMGQGAARNRGIERARAPYVAFIDSDDIQQPERFAVQYDFMQKNPDIVLCSSNYRTLSKSKEGREVRNPEFHDSIVQEALFHNRINTSGTMIRKDKVLASGIRQPDISYGEDYVFNYECSKVGKLHNLQQSLLYYRVGQSTSLTAKHFGSGNTLQHPIVQAYSIILPQILGRKLADHFVLAHVDLCRYFKGLGSRRYAWLVVWVFILLFNKKLTRYQKICALKYFYEKNISLARAVILKVLRKFGIVETAKQDG